MVDRIALAHGVATSTLRSLVQSESEWNPTRDNGQDRGLCQINRKAWPNITDEQAFDPDWCLNWTADKISKGEEYRWVVCSCWATVKTKVDKLPKMVDIIPNTSNPKPGEVAIFQYGNIKHIAYIEKVVRNKITLYEGNYKPCVLARREVINTDHNLVGYFLI